VPYKLPVDAKEVEYFKLYFDGKLVGDIKSEINRYAEQLLASSTEHLGIGLGLWLMNYMLFAMVILMGVVVKKSIKDYWSTKPVIKTPFFLKHSAERFLQILCIIHFVDNSSAPMGPDRPVFDFLVRKFSGIYMPSKKLALMKVFFFMEKKTFIQAVYSQKM